MKQTFSTRILACVLTVALLASMMVFNVSAADSATLSFADKAQRTEFSTTQQIWEQNGIKFTNNKSASTNAVADYAAPARFYAGSQLIVECSLGNINQIVFDCNSSSYASALKTSIGGTATVSSDKVTVTLDGSTNSFTVAKLTAQVRMDSLTVSYVTAGSEDTSSAVKEALKDLTPEMAIAYKYTTTKETVDVTATVVDTLNRALTGVTGTKYADWTGKTSESDAVYAGQSAGDHDSIQMRTTNSNSGIITTTSGGTVKKITVVWNSNTGDRTIDIYGSNTAFTSPTELYNADTCGVKLGSIVKGTSTILVVEGDYEYIGIRSKSGALYIDSIEIEWDTGAATGTEEVEVPTEGSEFAFRFGVGDAIASIEGVEAYGLIVSAGGKEIEYNTDSSSWTQDEGRFYVTVLLGDIINDIDKLMTKFTVQAYVQVGDNTYYTAEKTYSVVDMIVHYHDVLEIPEVEHLYNYLESKGLI